MRVLIVTDVAGDSVDSMLTQAHDPVDTSCDRPQLGVHAVSVPISTGQVRGRLVCAWRWLLRARPRESLQLLASIEHALSDLDETAAKGYCSHIALLRALACALEHGPEALLENLAGLGFAQHDAHVRSLLGHSMAAASTHAQARRPERSGEQLSPRECAVLLLISQGKSNKRVARALDITPETVKSHLKRVFVKLGSCTRAEAVARATALGLLTGAANGAPSPRAIDAYSAFPSTGDRQASAARHDGRPVNTRLTHGVGFFGEDYLASKS